MTIKDRISALLKERNVRAFQMEEDLGLAKGYISKLDKSSPNSDKLLNIANYLNVSLDYIMTGQEKGRNVLTYEEEAIIAAYRKLSEDNKNLVCKMLNVKRDLLLSKEA